jgi:hypothetical protein
VPGPGGPGWFGTDPSPGGDCYTGGGYDDIQSGAQVTVKDESGTVIALGALDPGHSDDVLSRTCVFGFVAADVPGGKSFYTVEVAHRGELKYTPEEAARPLELTLGN